MMKTLKNNKISFSKVHINYQITWYHKNYTLQKLKKIPEPKLNLSKKLLKKALKTLTLNPKLSTLNKINSSKKTLQTHKLKQKNPINKQES